MKKQISIYVVLFVALSLILPLKLHAESIVGNGGDVVVCKINGKEKVRLLDFFEIDMMKNFYKKIDEKQYDEFLQLTPDYKNFDGIRSKVMYSLDKMKDLSPLFTRRINTTALIFLNDVETYESLKNELPLEKINEKLSHTYFIDGTLQDLPDANFKFIPDNCEVKQLVIHEEESLYVNKRFIVNVNLWNKLNQEDKAGTITHEAIYYDAISYFRHNNSTSSRYFNALISSNKISSISLEAYVSLVKKLRFCNNKRTSDDQYYGDILFLGRSLNINDVKFSDDKIEGTLLEPIQENIYGINFAIPQDDKVTILTSGKIIKGVGNIVGENKIGNFLIYMNSTEAKSYWDTRKVNFEFNEKGELLSLTSNFWTDSPLVIDHPEFRLEVTLGKINFKTDETGNLFISSIASHQAQLEKVTPRITKFILKNSNQTLTDLKELYFNNKGFPTEAFPGLFTNLYLSNDRFDLGFNSAYDNDLFKKQGKITFYDNIAAVKEFVIYGGNYLKSIIYNEYKFSIEEDQSVILHENGIIKRAITSKEEYHYFKNIKNKKVTLKGRNQIELDNEGRLLSSNNLK